MLQIQTPIIIYITDGHSDDLWLFFSLRVASINFLIHRFLLSVFSLPISCLTFNANPFYQSWFLEFMHTWQHSNHPGYLRIFSDLFLNICDLFSVALLIPIVHYCLYLLPLAFFYIYAIIIFLLSPYLFCLYVFSVYWTDPYSTWYTVIT